MWSLFRRPQITLAVCAALFIVVIVEYLLKYFLRSFLMEQPLQVIQRFMVMVAPIGLTLTRQEVCRVFEKLLKEPKLDFYFQDNLFRGIFKKIEMDPFLSKIIDPTESIESYHGYSKFTLKFNDKHVEQSFRLYKMQKIWISYCKPFMVLLLLNLVQSLILIFNDISERIHANTEYLAYYYVVFYLRLLVSATILGMVIYGKRYYEKLKPALLINLIKMIFYRLVVVLLLCQIFEKMVFLANTNIVSMYWQVSVYCWDMVIPPLYYVFLINGLGFVANIYNIALSHQFLE